MPKARFILNPKNKKGIIAEIVGESGLRIQKRRSDNHPINIFIKGKDYDVVANCTLTGEPVHIEVAGGKIVTEDLLIEERDTKDGKENDTNDDNKSGTGDESGKPNKSDKSDEGDDDNNDDGDES